MIKSMTGFGRSKLTLNGRDYTVEIKTVNHRYNDVSVRMPRYLIALEDSLRQYVAKNISRGKTDVFVSVSSLENSEKNIKVDTALAGAYISELRRIAEMYHIQDGITATALMKVPDMMVIDDEVVDEELYWEEVKACTELALENLKKSREMEGQNLREDILNRLELVSKGIDSMEAKSVGLVDEYRRKLKSRIEELGASNIVDENRIAAELILFADRKQILLEIKFSISKKKKRMRSHIKSLREMLDSENAVGKKLDFLIQEMNREVNTIASKANCIDIVNYVVATKNEIENIREQVQNIE